MTEGAAGAVGDPGAIVGLAAEIAAAFELGPALGALFWTVPLPASQTEIYPLPPPVLLIGLRYR